MIENRVIVDDITLQDLIAQAICVGVMAGRGQIDYATRGPYHLAKEILDGTDEMVQHRSRLLGLRGFVAGISQVDPNREDHERK
jgi:dihydrodipicolinate synthase/N-acetylneuraminate lyase